MQESFLGDCGKLYDDTDSSEDDYDDDGLDAIIREGDLIPDHSDHRESKLIPDHSDHREGKPWVFGSPGSPSIQQLLR